MYETVLGDQNAHTVIGTRYRRNGCGRWDKKEKDVPSLRPTLEINLDHGIVRKLTAGADGAVAEDAAWPLFDQALLMEGVSLQDPAALLKDSMQ